MDSMCSWRVIESADFFFFRATVGAYHAVAKKAIAMYFYA